MEKRYQVFISSTFMDLQLERQEVLQALLELDCLPSGMELFPAADEDQWSLIQRVISDCDYYILVSAGRYGSIGPEGKSYTHMEYEYASSLKKPIIAFIHKDIGTLPANLVEDSKEGRKQLEDFHEICKKKLVKFWTTPHELGSIVSRSLIQLMKTRPAVGWVRADNLPSEESAAEMLRLRSVIDSLEEKLSKSNNTVYEDTSDLAQGDDEIELNFKFRGQFGGQRYNVRNYEASNRLKFREIFAATSPFLMDEAQDDVIKDAIDNLIATEFSEYYIKETECEIVKDFSLTPDSLQTIKVQMVALGLIEKGIKKRQIQDRSTYWKLTQRGEIEMMKERAIRKS